MRTNETNINNFKAALYMEEMSRNTIEKYIRDIRKFMQYTGNREITKQLTMEYKEYLLGKYSVRSVNSYIVSLNRFLSFIGCEGARVKTEKIQEDAYESEEKNLSRDEYMRLINAATAGKNERLAMIMQTICSTGIRISELKYITAEAVNEGKAHIRNKGKNRLILIPGDMLSLLKKYIKKHGISSGAVFVTKNGNPVDRSNISKEMKRLCKEAGVSEKKVFPHNLRHLFARTFYKKTGDIAKLADVLGHSRIDTTRIYIKTPSNEHKKLLDNMNLVIKNSMEVFYGLGVKNKKKNTAYC